MKAKTKKRSFENIEIFLGLSILLVVIVVIIDTVMSLNNNDKYQSIKSDADNFVESALLYANEINSNLGNKYYLSDIYKEISKLDDIKDRCDIYDSYVEIDSKKVRLSCDDILVEGEYNKTYYIYEISSWNKEETLGETIFLYNYKKDDKEVLDKYTFEKELIEKYNQNENASINNLDLLYEDAFSKGINVTSDIFYRNKKLIKEL